MSLVCPLCNEKKHAVIYKKIKQFPAAMIVKCVDCGHIYTYLEHYPEAEQLYNDEVYKVVETRDSLFDRILTWEYNRVIKQVEFLNPSANSVLDFGCGKGKFGQLVKNKGWEIKCVETSKERAEYAKKNYGLDVNMDYYIKGNIFDQYLDVITIFHVLEHLPQPKILLYKLISGNLIKNGLVIIEVPNFNSLQANIAGNNWLHLDIPRHVNHFTHAQLKNLAKSLGLKTKRTTFFSVHLGVLGMIDSILKLFGYRRHIIYDLKNKKTSWLILTIIFLFPLAFILESVSAIFGYGGIIRVYLSYEPS